MTGTPTEYDPADEERLYEAMGDIPDTADGFEVVCDLEWSGDTRGVRHRALRLLPHHNQHDRVHLEQVRAAKAAADKAHAALGKAETAEPERAKSYNAKGWHAQLGKLISHRSGSAAADAAGLDPSARTLTRWLSGEQTPSAANRNAIAAAYEDLATQGGRAAVHEALTGARASVAQANHALAQSLNTAMKDTKGVPIRIFAPERFNWS